MSFRSGLVLLVVLTAGLSGCTSKDRDPGPQTGTDGPTHRFGSLTVDFEYAPAAPAEGQTVQFTDLSADESFEIVEYAWDFGDGFASTERHPKHAYASAGIYTVNLRVRNAADVQGNASDFVAVHETEGPPGNEAPPPGDFLFFGKPVTVQASGGGEPSLAIDKKGRIYVSPVGDLYRSTDDGKSFQRLTLPGVISGDSHVVVDKDETVWVSDLGGHTPPLAGSVSVYVSDTHGDSWARQNPVASASVLNDRQWLAAKGDGTAYLVYRQVPTGAKMTKTTDGGLTWLPVGPSFLYTSFPFVDPRDGTLYVVEADDGTIRMSVSTNGGTSFTTSNVATRKSPATNIFVNGAVDDAGNVYVTWSDKVSGQFDVYVASSTNRGAKWSAPVLASGGTGTHIFPWIAAGGDGKVVVAWYGTNYVGDPNDAPDSTEWSVYTAQSLNAHDPKPVYWESIASPKSVHKGNICTGGTLGCDGKDRDLLDFFMVQVGPDGRAAVAYGRDDGTQTTAAVFQYQVDGPRSR